MKKYAAMIFFLTIGTWTSVHAETKLNCYKKTHWRNCVQRE